MTVGVDIGTTSVKALAVDESGDIVARARVAHTLRCDDPGELAHDADQAWRRGALAACAAVCDGLDVAAVNVAAMVPSLCAVDDRGVPIGEGLLYGDARGAGVLGAKNPSESGEFVRFLAWMVEHHPEAAGYWPAQAVANHALGGAATIDTVVAMTTLPLFDFSGWDAGVAASAGLENLAMLPSLISGSGPVGTVDLAGGALLGPGTIDAYGEQLVAGADRPGDVLVILGSTLIVWVVVDEWVEVEGLWTVPHTVAGKVLIGGPSNAGGLFVGWANRLLAAVDGRAYDTDRVPVWQPYLRGERVPWHDADRRASLHDAHIAMGAAEMRRAVHEASAFAVRHIVELSGADARRIVATGGGTHDDAWLRALADGTGLPVDVAAVAEGGALGAAYLSRVTAGLEADTSGAGRWARTARRVLPDDDLGATQRRYHRYRELAG